MAVYLAMFRQYGHLLAPGERATVMVLAADRRQARVVFRYIQGLIEGVPMLARLVVGRTAEGIHLNNQVTIEVHTASYRAVRGYTVVAAILDEIAFWRSEDSANPDVEILNAIRPAMATVPGALLLAISSPYARRGALWNAHRDHFGHDDDPVLVWQADTRSMNPSVDDQIIRDAYDDDSAAAAAEYGADFRRDVEPFLSREMVEAVIISGRDQLPPISDIAYVGFVDPSGGTQDSMTLAITHRDGDRIVLDYVTERRAPLSPDDVVREFAAICQGYRITTITGDRYAGEWPRERFRAYGLSYSLVTEPKSELYQELSSIIMARRVDLLDKKRLTAQLVSLERHVGRTGRDIISHPPPKGYDDVANAVAGAVVLADRRYPAMFADLGDEVRRRAAQGIPEPRWWKCPKCCYPELTDAPNPTCPVCNPGWTWRDIRW